MTNTNANLAALISEAAELIAVRDVRLAGLFRSQPFQRVNLAHAFAAGLRNGAAVDSDPHPEALLVIRVALLDRDARALAAAA